MTLYPGFQKQVNLNVYQGYPGDLASDRCAVILGANGKFASGDVNVGYGCFLTTNGNQVASDTTTAGTSVVAGFVLRNWGAAPMTWVQSDVGYGMTVPDGKQATVAFAGDFYSVVTGVNGSGAANHVPTVGENIWVKTTDGSLASAPASVTTVTGYVQAAGWYITGTGGLTPATVGANQTFAKFSGSLGS